MNRPIHREWWLDFYRDFRPVFGILPARSATNLVKRIIDELGLRKGSTFLDCPCGYGRVAIPLAKRGIRVTGVDIMPAYLEELAGRARRAKLTIPTVLGDMRRITFENEFDAAGNIWTSFGYFEKESDNLLVLKKIFKALRRDGRFFMTVINRDWVVTHFESVDYMEAGKVRVLETREFDYRRSASVSNWHFFKGSEEAIHPSFIRMYSLHELLGMMKSAGFVDVRGYGSRPGDAVSKTTRMLTIVGTKPGGRQKRRAEKIAAVSEQPVSKKPGPDDWWPAFAPEARIIFNTISPRETRDQVNYVVSKLHLAPGSRFLDCGCGIGRIGLPLAAKGVKVTGIDLSPEYIAEFNEKARRRNITVEAFPCDMRRISFDKKFDGVGNLCTSFGYFQLESDNVLALKKLYTALKPGGRFILTITNRDWILKYFSATDWQDIGPVRLLQRRRFDYERSAVIADWHFIKDGTESRHQTYVRSYSLHEMRAMLESIGFVNVNGFGSLKDEPLTPDCRWMIVVAQRPK